MVNFISDVFDQLAFEEDQSITLKQKLKEKTCKQKQKQKISHHQIDRRNG